MTIEGSGASRAGGDGIHNEDAFLVEQGLGLYLVCDGVGSRPAGEVAARIAARALEEFVEECEEELDLRSGQIARVVVERALHYAMDSLAEAERTDPELEGLSTTVTLLLAHGRLGVIGHRGDSRAYLVRRGRARQLTIDDELTEASPGQADDSDFDVFALELEPDDTIILCTDGAEHVMQDPAIVRSASEYTPRILASRIVSAAHRHRPDQDATAVVVRVRGDLDPGWLELSSEPHGTAFGRAIERA